MSGKAELRIGASLAGAPASRRRSPRRGIMDEIVKEFLIESAENLERLDQELVALESDPSSTELLSSIFRTIHTIKGSCGFLGFAHLEKVAHAGENLLSQLRDGKVSLTAEVTSGLLAMVDAVRRMLAAIQASETDGDNDYPEVREELKRLQEGEAPTARPESPSAPAPATERQAQAAAETACPAASETPRILETQAAASGPVFAPTAQSPNSQHHAVGGKIGGLLVERGNISLEELEVALQDQERGDRRKLGEILISMGVCSQGDVATAQRIIESKSRETGMETVRIGIALLDKLMNLVGELVLTRNQLLQFANSTPDTSFQAISQRMNLIASELQEEVMKTRMQPIGNIWNKFPRTVRDLARGCGKEVRIEMVGKETELDRTIIEAIKDPLTHLVRNSLDHGIELPAARVQAGKPACGCLTLRAFHEGGQVNIEISDDGAGLSRERICAKAVERGLLTAEQSPLLPDRDVFGLIFLPGFSTAEKVTSVSGRGVGMDVVKTNVEKIGGTVDVQSTPGQGTTVRVKIPLTLAIIPALVVRSRGERFAIPQVSLTELVRLESTNRVEMVQGVPVYRLRGRLLPIVYLEHLLVPANGSDPVLPGDNCNEPQGVTILVLQAESRLFGLVVDDILDTQEIVVKPVGGLLKGLDIYSGATIMGDGRVALILDVLGLAHRANVMAEPGESGLGEKGRASVLAAAASQQSWLLVECGRDGHQAMPLSAVARLEEFPASSLERSGGQEVIQYRGEIIPLIRLSQFLGVAEGDCSPAGNGMVQVVVYSEGARTAGLLVDRIVDIAEGKAQVQSFSGHAGVAGSFVIQRRVTELLDVPAIVRAAAPGFFEARAGGER